jgi:DNA-binding NtrC family response regulator
MPSAMPRAATITATLDGGELGQRELSLRETRSALALVWAEHEVERVGEVMFAERLACFFGRDSEEAEARAALVRQRPGQNEPTAPLKNAFLSRRHLKLQAAEDDGIALECLGKRPLFVNGKELPRALVRPGDLVELRGLYLFLCVERPRRLPESEVCHEFGAPDADGVVGESPAAWELRRQISFAAERGAHVLVTGPSGSGKELVARGIHRRSSRRAREMVSRSAATLPSGLIDAELFGNIANYPNVGMPERPGLLGQAHGSTLFLDEIGELAPELQAHLLRALDAGEYQRLGDARPRVADLRLVAATNRAASELKPDLAARFTLRIEAPGLSARSEDVPLIARHIVQRIAHADAALARRFLTEGGTPRFSAELMRGLVRHAYTTHVRELEGLLWRSAQTSPADTLELTPELAALLGDDEEPRATRSVSAEELRESLARHGGVKDKVWRDLGLSSRHALHRLMKKLGVEGGAD